jgi:hypothetical protein
MTDKRVRRWSQQEARGARCSRVRVLSSHPGPRCVLGKGGNMRFRYNSRYQSLCPQKSASARPAGQKLARKRDPAMAKGSISASVFQKACRPPPFPLIGKAEKQVFVLHFLQCSSKSASHSPPRGTPALLSCCGRLPPLVSCRLLPRARGASAACRCAPIVRCFLVNVLRHPHKAFPVPHAPDDRHHKQLHRAHPLGQIALPGVLACGARGQGAWGAARAKPNGVE